MKRVYTPIIIEHIRNDSQMLFLAGPRQVGKTTVSITLELRDYESIYLNWDDNKDKELILRGSASIIDHINLDKARTNKPILIFDELHKHKDWKNFLKSFYDKHKEQLHIIVTGSAKLDIYRKGSDSLMGRYFLYRIHPLSIAELTTSDFIRTEEIKMQSNVDDSSLDNLLIFGGYPEPFLKADDKFKNKWQGLKKNQLFKEDILELTKINEIVLLEQLAFQLKHFVGNLVNKDELSKRLQVAATTIKHWMSILELSYYCFYISPWSKNISRSILKTPKVYLWDWSEVEDTEQKLENLMASHLLKATHYWTDCGYGKYELFFLRNKDKQEVDFLVTKNMEPWFLVEVKTSDQKLNKNLLKFQKESGAKHAFQVVKNMEQVDINCFNFDKPVVVPMSTFLSQLI